MVGKDSIKLSILRWFVGIGGVRIPAPRMRGATTEPALLSDFREGTEQTLKICFRQLKCRESVLVHERVDEF